jgi:hypothetical protein
MMTAEDKKTKMLETVRALFAKADSTNFPAEADAFREKADTLMTQYAIEQWEIDAAAEAKGSRPKPVSREFDMKWYQNHSRSAELWQMMQAVAAHCRVKLVYWRYNGMVPGVGIPSDLDYFDMLFTSLMLQMGKGLEPHPNPERSMIENLVEMKEAGMKWERIGELLIGAEQLESYDRNIGVKFTKLYTDYCMANNRPRLRTTPSVYQRSFAQGFVEALRERLRRQEEKSTGSMELVLRDIRHEVDAAAEDMFGEDPKRYSMVKSGQVDGAAFQTGQEAGRKARIHHNPNETVKQGTRGMLGS